MLNEVWVLIAQSESDVNYGPWVFSYRPEPSEINEVLHSIGSEYDHLSMTRLYYNVPVIYA